MVVVAVTRSKQEALVLSVGRPTTLGVVTRKLQGASVMWKGLVDGEGFKPSRRRGRTDHQGDLPSFKQNKGGQTGVRGRAHSRIKDVEKFEDSLAHGL